MTVLPANTHVFVKRSVFKMTLAQLQAFHQDPSALRKLTPPPIFMRLHDDRRTSITEGEIEFTLWFGPLPVRWTARHASLDTGTGFRDYQVKGPLAYWNHEHIMEDVEGGAALTDRITIAHHPGLRGILTRLMFDGIPLQILFAYRHWRTARAVEN
ncbi:MAG: hypothetical protein IPM16_07565 [Chloroflexi bacterium]|nr:hypothetical protein [Chloroflexota bacterium]